MYTPSRSHYLGAVGVGGGEGGRGETEIITEKIKIK